MNETPLTDQLIALAQRAADAAANAYVPYSSFPVGAAVLCTDGAIHAGCNVENASYGLTICAERAAMVAAAAAGQRSFQAIAIHVSTPDGQPCGACRQFIREFGPDIVVVYPRGGQLVAVTIEQLIPDSFDAATLP